MKIEKKRIDKKNFELDLNKMTEEEICQQFDIKKLWEFNEWLARFKRQDWTWW